MENQIDITKYDGIYTDRYYKLLNIHIHDIDIDNIKEETFTIVKDRYKALYNVKNYYPLNSFGLHSWKSAIWKTTNISFYEDDILLFTKKSYNLPCLIIHNDTKKCNISNNYNQTRDNTFFSIREDFKINIYNMNNVFIRSVSIGPDCLVDFKRVNNKYAVGITEEMCCNDPFTSLINLDDFFNENIDINNKKVRAYDNSRIPLILRSDSQIYDTLRYFPIVCTETGFLVEDLRTKKIVSEIIPYDKVYSGEIDFDDNEKENPNIIIYNSLVQSGFDMKELERAVIENEKVYISSEYIPKDIIKPKE